jgi:hypothetical protein
MLKKIHNCNAHHTNLNLSLLVLVANLFLFGCVPPPSQYATIADETVQPAPPPTKVYFYPTRGQSQEQQGRDNYECYLWAVKQTGFDPSATNLAPHHKLTVVAEPPPGIGTATGAISGAVLGAIVSSRGNRPEGVMLGAMAGALVGSASDVARQEQTDRLQQYYDRQSSAQMGNIERQATNYRRAITACLEGRGYSVQ